jgi:RimJ/RimL family protein N-acetyltransferase
MEVLLETARLTLRRFTAADADNLFELNSDPEVMRFINGGKPTPRAEVSSGILPYLLSCYQRFDGLGYWAAQEKASGQFVGWFHLRPRAADGEIELGYRLRRPAWGKGYATEGSRALIRKGFTEFGVQRVVAETMAVNLGSRRVMEKSGLTLARALPAQGQGTEGSEHGDVEYALSRTDWESGRRD